MYEGRNLHLISKNFTRSVTLESTFLGSYTKRDKKKLFIQYEKVVMTYRLTHIIRGQT